MVPVTRSRAWQPVIFCKRRRRLEWATDHVQMLLASTAQAAQAAASLALFRRRVANSRCRARRWRGSVRGQGPGDRGHAPHQHVRHQSCCIFP